MTITRTITREHDNTLYALQKNDSNYALMKNGEMYYATKKGIIETVTLTLTPKKKTWQVQRGGITVWVAPFNAEYTICYPNGDGTHKKYYKKGTKGVLAKKAYKYRKYDDGEIKIFEWGVSFDDVGCTGSNFADIILDGYIDNEGTFYPELPSDAITKE